MPYLKKIILLKQYFENLVIFWTLRNDHSDKESSCFQKFQNFKMFLKFMFPKIKTMTPWKPDLQQ